jgi:hypothetical protein
MNRFQLGTHDAASEVGGAHTIIPANAGIHVVHLIDYQCSRPNELDSRFRGNDGKFFHPFSFIHSF